MTMRDGIAYFPWRTVLCHGAMRKHVEQANCLLPFSRENCAQPRRVQLTTCERHANHRAVAERTDSPSHHRTLRIAANLSVIAWISLVSEISCTTPWNLTPLWR